MQVKEDKNSGIQSSELQKTETGNAAYTPLPWVVQRLNHVNDEPWYQIGWVENGNELGPVCELVGGAVQPTRSFKAVAEFKYLVASEEEIRANAEFIVRACNSHDALVKTLHTALLKLETSTKDRCACYTFSDERGEVTCFNCECRQFVAEARAALAALPEQK